MKKMLLDGGTPIELPNPDRPLPEIWDGQLIIWGDWEYESDFTGFLCSRLDPWERYELEALFHLAGPALPGVSDKKEGNVGPCSRWNPGQYHCPHCEIPNCDPLKNYGRTYIPRPSGRLIATRCTYCYKDVVYTYWDGVEWVMEEADYAEASYMQEGPHGESPWELWEQKLATWKLFKREHPHTGE